MSVVKMQKFLLCGLESDREPLLKALQKNGQLHLKAQTPEDPSFRPPASAQEKSSCEKIAQNMLNALTVLDTYAPAKGGLLDSLKGRKPLTSGRWEERSALEAQAVEAAARIQGLQKELSEQTAREVRLQAALEPLVPWASLPVPLDYGGTKNCKAIIGALPGQWTADSVEQLLAQEAPEAESFTAEVISSEPSQTCLMVLALRSEADRLEDVLRRKGFARPAQAPEGVLPSEYRRDLEKQIARAREEQEATREELAACGGSRTLLQFCYDDNVLKAQRKDALGKALSTGRVIVFSGYLPAGSAEAVKKQLEDAFVCSMELSDASDDPEAPVLLKNNPFSEPTESVVLSYGAPHKGEVDPTLIMSFFYYFLFGLMLSDAGYGLVMAIGCFAVLRLFPKIGSGLKQMLKMFFWCGVSTTFWGVMFGSYFGDAIPVIADKFFHTTVTVPALWLVPLEEPMTLLIWCFAFGIVHLFVGLGIKGYMLLRDKQWLDFFAGVLCWYFLLIGLLLMLLPTDIYASIAGAAVPLPKAVSVLAVILAVIGALGIIFFTAHRRKNFGLRIAMGAYELYGATSWLSDILSYSRLLALGLATGVIATVFNQMAAMVVNTDTVFSTIVSVILFATIFLVGHVLNMAINLLGAYVHTNRLQYVEFFGKFYEGGGEEYAPLSAENTQ